MSAEFYLASRYLLGRRQGAWGFLISLLATFGVAIGVAALIVTLAIMNGFRQDIQKKMLGVNPHIILTSFSGEINLENPKIEAVLKKDPRVVAWSPFVFGQILIGRGKNSTGATIKGVNTEKELMVANLTPTLIQGQWADLHPKKINPKVPPIIIGQELARRIDATVGDKIWVITPNSIEVTALSIPRAQIFQIVGLMNSGLYDYDTVLTYTNLVAAQTLFDLKKNVTGVGIRTQDANQAESVASDLRVAYEGAFWIRSWISQNKNLFSALRLERIVMTLILGLLTIVAAFMIVSNLLLTVTQKSKEIGILRAMGATPGVIEKIFLFQGLLIALVGNGIGLLLGLSLCLLIDQTQLFRLPADVYYIDKVPVYLIPHEIILVIVFAFAVVLLAAFYPAKKAADLDPLDAIRYG